MSQVTIFTLISNDNACVGWSEDMNRVIHNLKRLLGNNFRIVDKFDTSDFAYADVINYMVTFKTKYNIVIDAWRMVDFQTNDICYGILAVPSYSPLVNTFTTQI